MYPDAHPDEIEDLLNENPEQLQIAIEHERSVQREQARAKKAAEDALARGEVDAAAEAEAEAARKAGPAGLMDLRSDFYDAELLADEQEALRALEQDVLDLHEMFLWLADVVATQSDILEEIDTIVGETLEFTGMERDSIDRAALIQEKLESKKAGLAIGLGMYMMIGLAV